MGYDYIDAGFQFRAKAERVPIGVRLQLEPSISTVTGFVRETPITEESTVQVDAIVRDGEWIIITGPSVEQASSDYSGIPGLPTKLGKESQLDDKATLLVMVQARRIFGSQPEE